MNQRVAPKTSFFSPAFLILIVVCSYFVITIYDLFVSLIFSSGLISNFATYAGLMKIPWWTATFYSSELGGTVGGILRSVASILALYSAFLYWRRKDAAVPQIRRKVVAALVLEGCYFLSFIPTIWLGFVYPSTGGNFWYFEVTPVNEVLFAAGFTSIAMVLVIPPVLFKLGAKITQRAPRSDIVKWSCIAAVSYLFVVFWFNSTMQWTGMLTTWDVNMLLDPLNLAGFAASVFGLFLVAIIGLVATLPAVKKLPVELSQRRIGVTSLGLGGYFVFGILIYFAAGGFAARPTAWYELMVPHNPYLWCVVFFFTGLPLLFAKRRIDYRESLTQIKIEGG